MNKIAEKTFRADLVLERSSSSVAEDLGNHESTMCLYDFDEPGRYMIEWDVPSLEETQHIGIWVNEARKELRDYDGVMSLPEEAIELLEEQGITVGEGFR